MEIPTIDDYKEKVWTMYYQMDNDRERLTRIITGEAQAEEQLAIESALQEYEANKDGAFDRQEIENILQNDNSESHNNYDYYDEVTNNKLYDNDTAGYGYDNNHYDESNLIAITATSNINDYDEDTNDWEAFQDKDGNEYYYNHRTGESSWKYPW